MVTSGKEGQHATDPYRRERDSRHRQGADPAAHRTDARRRVPLGHGGAVPPDEPQQVVHLEIVLL